MSRQDLKWNDFRGIWNFYWKQNKFKLTAGGILSVALGSPFVLKIYDYFDTGRWQPWNFEGTIMFGCILFGIVLPLAYFLRNNE